MNKLTLKWSKREKDWLCNYPDNAGSSLMGVLFDMTNVNKHRTQYDQDLKTMLTEHGYDYTTFKITVDKL